MDKNEDVHDNFKDGNKSFKDLDGGALIYTPISCGKTSTYRLNVCSSAQIWPIRAKANHISFIILVLILKVNYAFVLVFSVIVIY